MIIEVTPQWQYEGRFLAGLRGDTRQRLDSLLTNELAGTGVGRSAFINAAIDWFSGMSEDDKAAFLEIADRYEHELPV